MKRSGMICFLCIFFLCCGCDNPPEAPKNAEKVVRKKITVQPGDAVLLAEKSSHPPSSEPNGQQKPAVSPASETKPEEKSVQEKPAVSPISEEKTKSPVSPVSETKPEEKSVQEKPAASPIPETKPEEKTAGAGSLTVAKSQGNKTIADISAGYSAVDAKVIRRKIGSPPGEALQPAATTDSKPDQPGISSVPKLETPSEGNLKASKIQDRLGAVSSPEPGGIKEEDITPAVKAEAPKPAKPEIPAQAVKSETPVPAVKAEVPKPAKPEIPAPAVKAEAPKPVKPEIPAQAVKSETPAPAVKAEAPKSAKPEIPAPAVKSETPSPTVKAEAPKPAKPEIPAPAVKAEAPKPAKPEIPAPAVKSETPSPAVKAEAPKPAKPEIPSPAVKAEAAKADALPAKAETAASSPGVPGVPQPTAAQSPSTGTSALPGTGGISDSAIAAIMGKDVKKKSPVKEVYDPKGRLDPFVPLFKEEKGISKAELEAKVKAAEEAKLKGKIPPKKVKEKRIPRTPLEKVDLSQLKLVGIIRSETGNRALVEEASGKGYIITKGTYIGIKSGRVTDILKDKVIIEEEEDDFSGETKTRRTEMKLQRPFGESYQEM